MSKLIDKIKKIRSAYSKKELYEKCPDELILPKTIRFKCFCSKYSDKQITEEKVPENLCKSCWEQEV